MKNVRIKFLGCGDAFGSGGRFQTCIFIKSDDTGFLLDCGASALISIELSNSYGIPSRSELPPDNRHSHESGYARSPK